MSRAKNGTGPYLNGLVHARNCDCASCDSLDMARHVIKTWGHDEARMERLSAFLPIGRDESGWFVPEPVRLEDVERGVRFTRPAGGIRVPVSGSGAGLWVYAEGIRMDETNVDVQGVIVAGPEEIDLGEWRYLALRVRTYTADGREHTDTVVFMHPHADVVLVAPPSDAARRAFEENPDFGPIVEATACFNGVDAERFEAPTDEDIARWAGAKHLLSVRRGPNPTILTN